MRNYKKTLLEIAGDPAVHAYHRVRTAGVIMDSNEKTNTAKARFLNRDGCFETRENITVRIQGDGTGWFPSKGELVTIEETADVCEIIAKYGGNYSSETRKNLLTEQDIYTDGIGSMPGGYVY